MSLHESAWGGVYLSPLFVYALLALAATAALRVLIQKRRCVAGSGTRRCSTAPCSF